LGRSGNNVALASGSTYTISFFIKKTGAHTIGGYYAIITGAASGNLGAGFDVSGSFSSGSIFNTAGTTNRIRRVEQWGTDVYRCSETFTMTASGTLTSFFLAPLNLVNDQPNPAVGTQLGFAAPQIELGASPTSFIPTTTAAVSRAADVISASGALVSGLIGQTEGTIYAEVDFSRLNLSPILTISDDNNNRIQAAFTANNNFGAIIRVASVNLNFFATFSNPQIIGINKIAIAYANNDYALALNGQVATSSSTRAIPACTKIGLGTSATDSSFLNDRIRAAALYTTRLSNAQLAELTRL
jgi:hypothetical protein